MKLNLQLKLSSCICTILMLLPLNMQGDDKNPPTNNEAWELKKDMPTRRPKAPSNVSIPFFYDGVEGLVIMFTEEEEVYAELTTVEGIYVVSNFLSGQFGYYFYTGKLVGAYTLRCKTADGSQYVGSFVIE